MKKRTNKGIFIVIAVIAFLCFFGYPLYYWYKSTFNTTFTVLVFTVQSPLKGANTEVVVSALKIVLIGLIIWVGFLAAGIILLRKELPTNTMRIVMAVVSLVLTGLFINLLVQANKTLEFTDYLRSRFTETHFIEQNYVEPDYNSIVPGDNPKNLIYLYMESMESAYASKEDGGRQETNYIPNLTQIANENISFSNTDKLGGFYNCSHTGWTSAALFATQSGLPFMTPIGGGAIWEDFSSLVTIGDILEHNGYNQEFICGSDAEFGGRKALFAQHGDFKIMDYPAAIEAGYIDEDYYVWWGFEDKILYDIAKQEITSLAQTGKPFNVTMLTVDTHYDGGYVCDLCDDEYPEQIANVIRCADNQVSDFLDWCKEQAWYDNTLIVIQGDHPSMTKALVEDIPSNERITYDCFINSGKNNVNVKNRAFVAMDMMPTVLYAMGFEVPNDRIGLGTNLFSETPTLAEEYGFDYINSELECHSQWFLENIVRGSE